MQIIQKALFYLKVSRPGLWFATIWLYLLPTSALGIDILYTIPFWIGFLYVCFPLNFLVYGWNDMVDFETDAVNPRKNSFWFGARGSKKELKQLWKPILLTQILFIPIILVYTDYIGLIIFLGFFVINLLYNLPKNGLRAKPPAELICQIGYLLIVPLSVLINHTVNLSFFAYVYLFLFAMQSHLMGEVMDYQPDLVSKRKTTATILGIKKTKLIIMLLVIAELCILTMVYHEIWFSVVLGLGLIWLLLDVFYIYKSKAYSISEMKLFALSSNLIGFATIFYVWYAAFLK